MITNFGDAVRATKRALPGKDHYFERVEALYWWLYEHHGGMSSWEYAAACTLSLAYTPGCMDNGPMTEMSQLMYDALCTEHGCEHGPDDRWNRCECCDGKGICMDAFGCTCSVCDGSRVRKEKD